jgi:hypothetical protein
LLNLTETIMNKEELIDAYAQQLLDSMDMKTMERFVYDTLVENLTDYTEEELITEVTDYYPELLGIED